MTKLGLETEIVDDQAYEASVDRFREAGIALPTFAQLADPATIPGSVRERLASVEPDIADPRNLFRVHWNNDPSRAGHVAVPQYLELPSALTGVAARIVLLLGDAFPMIRAHKVLAAYGCLAPRIVTGQFDPLRHRAIWPSTGNYCRGGVAISRIMGCHGVAILPEGMSGERFQWLARCIPYCLHFTRSGDHDQEQASHHYRGNHERYGGSGFHDHAPVKDGQDHGSDKGQARNE